MPVPPANEMNSFFRAVNSEMNRQPSRDDAKDLLKVRAVQFANANSLTHWIVSGRLDPDIASEIDDHVNYYYNPPSRGATRQDLMPPQPQPTRLSQNRPPRIKIIDPDPGKIIPLKREPTSTGTGPETPLYHDKIPFICEVTDGKPPFEYVWRIWIPTATGPGAQRRLFFPREPPSNNRSHSFFKGGEDVAPFNFQIVRPIPDHRYPRYQHASIPAGSYRVRVDVKDGDGREAKAEIEIFVTDSAVLWARIEEPKSRNSWYVKKVASTGQFCHEKIKFRAAAGGGKGYYTFEWTLTNIPGTGPLPIHESFGALPSPTRTIIHTVEPSAEPGTHDKFNLVHDEFVLGGEDHPILRSATPGDTGDDNASLDAGEWRIELKVTDSEGNVCNQNMTDSYGNTLLTPNVTNIFINREPESTVMKYDREEMEKGGITEEMRKTEAARTLREEREKLRSGPNYREQEHPMFYQSRWRGIQEGQEQIEGMRGFRDIKRAASWTRGAASRNLGPGKGAWLRGTAERQGGFGPMMDPYLRGAIAWSRKQLGIIAQQEYERIWKETRPDLIAATNSYREEKKNYRQLHEKADEIYKHLADHPDASATKAITSVIGGAVGGGGPGAALGAAGALLGTMTGGEPGKTGEAAVRIITEKLQEMDRRLREKENQFRKILASRDVYDSMTKYLKENVDRIADEACWKYKISLDNKSVIAGDLGSEVVKLAEIWQLQSRTALRGTLARTGYLIRNVSYASKTLGDVWFALLSNLWEFLMGPWIVGAIIVILQFLMLAFYAHASFAYLYMMPIIGAIIVFILNFSESKYPMEWVQHLVTGVVIGYSALILLLALHMDEVVGVFWFWIIWFILVIFIGAFQIYATGGWKAVLSVAMVILLFGYIALGPYHGYYDYVKGEVKKPLEIGWRALKDAFENVWLLATNPTEWYARQQTINVRPEKPIDWPHALEITRIDALPPSVPASNPFRNCEPPSTFAMVTIIQNQGDMDATNIVESIGCNEWCKVDKQTATKDKDILRPGEGQIVQFQNLAAYCPEKDHAAEFEMAKVFINFTYTYRTNSTLQTQVMSRTEIERLFAEGKDVYENVPAVSKVGPAQLSLNVGPQPLTAGLKKTILLVSVSNTRSDGYIILEPGMNVIITLPKSIGSGLNCAAGKITSAINDSEKEVWTFRINEHLEVRPFEFKSIFAFICQFDVRSDISEVRTGLIRAELPEYKYKVTKDKDIPISLPLGIFSGALPGGPEAQCNAPADTMKSYTDKETLIKNAVNKSDFIDPSDSTIKLKSLTEIMGSEAQAKALVASKIWPMVSTANVPNDPNFPVTQGMATAEQIKKLMTDRGSPIVNTAELFVKYGQQYGIDSAFGVGVAEAETSLGQTTCAGISSDCNNYFCIKYVRRPLQDRSVRGSDRNPGPWACYDTPDRAIEDFFSLIKNNYVNANPKQDTPAKICCLPGSGINSHCYLECKSATEDWIVTTVSIRAEIHQSAGTAQDSSDPTQGKGLMHITQEQFTEANCTEDPAINAAYDSMTDQQNLYCGVKWLILQLNKNKDAFANDYSYQEWNKCIFTQSAFAAEGLRKAILDTAALYVGCKHTGSSDTSVCPKPTEPGKCAHSIQCGAFVASVFNYGIQDNSLIGHAQGDQICDGPGIEKKFTDSKDLKPGDIFSMKISDFGHTGIYVGTGSVSADNKKFEPGQEPNKQVVIHSTRGGFRNGQEDMVQYGYLEDIIGSREVTYCTTKTLAQDDRSRSSQELAKNLLGD